MRITRKGQVTIPAHIRRHAGLGPGAVVEVEVRDGCVCIRPIEADHGARLVSHLRERGDVSMSTDEVMALTRRE